MIKRAALALSSLLVLGLCVSAEALPVADSSAGVAISDNHVQRPAIAPRVARALGPAGEMRGMSINDVGALNRGVTAVTADFPRLVADGVTSVTLYIYLYVSVPKGNEVFADLLTPTDEEIAIVAEAAREAGLTLHVSPVLLDKETNGWRGSYTPSNLTAFFGSYTAQVIRYAAMAERLGATLFYIGSENDRLAGQTQHWRKLIADVRPYFSGALTYLASSYTPLRVQFWRDLDLVAMSVYFSLGEDATPTYERVLSAWREVHTPYVRSLVKKLKMPIVYGEAGYHSQQHAFAHPAQAPKFTRLAAPQAQANAYRGLLDVLAKEPGVYGVTWWRWAAGTTTIDTTYSPANKPAECVIASHWSQEPEVRAAADDPQCDLTALDAALVSVAAQIPQD